MTWQDIAYKDISDASRSRGLWLLFGLLLVLMVGYAGLHPFVGDETFPSFVTGLSGVIGLTLPVLSLFVGYKAVIHDRSSGALLLTLSMPHSRRDFVGGKLVGRSVVVVAPTVVAALVAGIVGVVRFGTEGLLFYPLFLLASALYGVAFVGIAVGLSMSTTIERRITFGALGSYFVLVSLWGNLHSTVLVILHRFNFQVLSNMPDWALLFRLSGPRQAYNRIVTAGFDTGQATQYTAEAAPLYVDWWMAILLLVAWFAVPILLGFRRFDSSDL